MNGMTANVEPRFRKVAGGPSMSPTPSRPVRRRNVLLDAPLIYRSSAFARVVEEAKRASRGSGMILLEGESGSGKGRIARLIHEQSGRAGAFAVWSAPEFQGSIAISEIFGHRKGSFTGADAERIGIFLSASGGTVLADDIDKLEKPLQGVVLRFLDDFCVRPVGSSEWTPVDLLFIASTNRNLHRISRGGEFLPDLANRLTTLVISIPPLRERREDIAPMVEYFMAEYARSYQIELQGITPEAMRILEADPWPGNVRGLASVMENAVFRSRGGAIDVEAVVQALGRQGQNEEAVDEPEDFTKLSSEERRTEAVIRRALEACQWNGKAASELLGIPLRTFRRYLSNYNIRKKFD